MFLKPKLTEANISKFVLMYMKYGTNFDEIVQEVPAKYLNDMIRQITLTIEKNERNGVYAKQYFDELGIGELL